MMKVLQIYSYFQCIFLLSTFKLMNINCLLKTRFTHSLFVILVKYLHLNWISLSLPKSQYKSIPQCKHNKQHNKNNDCQKFVELISLSIPSQAHQHLVHTFNRNKTNPHTKKPRNKLLHKSCSNIEMLTTITTHDE